jgi:streptomycin 6-kinase
MDLPEAVRRKAAAVGQSTWLAGLPSLVAKLSDEWSIDVGRIFPDATEAFVAEAEQADGTAAVLKVAIPRDGDQARREAAVLRRAAGQGCARLLSEAPDRHAALLERLGPSMHDLGLPLSQRHAVLCDTAALVWRAAPDLALPTGADHGRFLADLIATKWDALDRPCSERAVTHAIACADRRVAAHDDERAVLVHGDVHQWNALRSTDGFKLVDPDGHLAEPELDLGIIMREDPVELMALNDPRDRARWLAAHTGLDAEAVWEWGVVERVSTGLVSTEIGLQPWGRAMLHAADVIALAG